MLERLKPELIANSLVRVTGRDAAAAAVLAAAAPQFAQLIEFASFPGPDSHDYAQIDPALQVATARQTAAAPQPGVGYAGLTPAQRAQFLTWLADPATPAPVAFQQLYLAQLEINLFAGGEQAAASRQELRQLSAAAGWREQIGLARAILLAYWLAQDGEGLAAWHEATPTPPALLGVLLGLQARLGTPLRPGQLPHILSQWQISTTPTAAPAASLWALRLQTLAAQLGADPLAHAVAQLGEAAATPLPWRSNHRDLRLLLPQPDLRRPLTALLVELTQLEQSLPASAPAPAEPAVRLEELGWRLILEFGHSRSELFHYALTLAQRLPGFSQLLDENRTVVYRVVFKQSEMRQFWRLWDYVQSWATTRVYHNGYEVEKWKVYPYSQFLR